MTHEFCSIFIWNTVKQRRSQHISLVQTKFNMSTLCFDNNRQSFWQLINRLVQRVLASLSPGVNQNLLKLISVWNFVTIDHLLQRSPQPTRTRFTAGNNRNMSNHGVKHTMVEQRLCVPAGRSACTPFTPPYRLAALQCAWVQWTSWLEFVGNAGAPAFYQFNEQCKMIDSVKSRGEQILIVESPVTK